MTTLTEPELMWSHREAHPPEVAFDERLERAGLVQCPGAYGRGCLAVMPIGSGMMLCQFCRGTVRRNATGRPA